MKEKNKDGSEMRPLNYKQLAALYNVSHRTLKSWLEPFVPEIGEMRGRFFTIKQIQLIYERLGYPQ